MENAQSIKIILSGLDNAGKTSILTALDRKYNFRKEIMELKPTVKVEYHQTTFMNTLVFLWDMGGQIKYRDLYKARQDIYFAGTDLLVYIIDIQDKDRFEISINYFNSIMDYFKENEMDIPVIVSFHKYDPSVRNDNAISENILQLRQKITDIYPSFKILFQQTSIFDIISIVQLISYGLSLFDEAFFELSELLESYLVDKFNCTSLILFDENGIIISEFYSDTIERDEYIELLENIKEHLFLLKRMQEENYELDYNTFSIENKLLSYLHKINFLNQSYYISVVIKEELKENLLKNFPQFVEDVNNLLKVLIQE